MKKILLGGIGLCGIDVAKAISAMPKVYNLGYNHKAEAKKRKKRLRELARRQKRLDKLNKDTYDTI